MAHVDDFNIVQMCISIYSITWLVSQEDNISPMTLRVVNWKDDTKRKFISKKEEMVNEESTIFLNSHLLMWLYKINIQNIFF